MIVPSSVFGVTAIGMFLILAGAISLVFSVMGLNWGPPKERYEKNSHNPMLIIGVACLALGGLIILAVMAPSQL